MIRKSTLIAATMALALGILPGLNAVMAHGHGHSGGHHHHEHHNHNHNHNYNSDEFWSGPEVREVVVFGGSDANADPCTDLNKRLQYPGLCPEVY